MLGRLGVEIIDLGIVPDRRDAVLEAFREASVRADVVLSSGGVSTGEADYIKEVLAELGRVGFWRIAIRPGRPLAFGFLGESVFFGLPGNPVAVMVTFYQFVEPAIRAASGEADARPRPAVEARCTTRLRKKPGRVEYYRAILERDASGAPVVRSTGKSGSGLLHTMSDANCFIVLPEDGVTVEPGSVVAVQPFSRAHVRSGHIPSERTTHERLDEEIHRSTTHPAFDLHPHRLRYPHRGHRQVRPIARGSLDHGRSPPPRETDRAG